MSSSTSVAVAFQSIFIDPDVSLAYPSYLGIGPTGLAVRRGALYVGGQLASTQLTVGATKIAETLCTDCDADRAVRANDVVAAIRIAMDRSSLEGCTIVDANEDGSADDAEIARVADLIFDSCRI